MCILKALVEDLDLQLSDGGAFALKLDSADRRELWLRLLQTVTEANAARILREEQELAAAGKRPFEVGGKNGGGMRALVLAVCRGQFPPLEPQRGDTAQAMRLWHVEPRMYAYLQSAHLAHLALHCSMLLTF